MAQNWNGNFFYQFHLQLLPFCQLVQNWKFLSPIIRKSTHSIPFVCIRWRWQHALSDEILFRQNGGLSPRAFIEWSEIKTKRNSTAEEAKTIRKDSEKHRWWRAYGFSNWRCHMAATKSLWHAKSLLGFERTCKWWLTVLECCSGHWIIMETCLDCAWL